MLRVLAVHLRGDHQACSMVRVPTPEEEDAKRTHREREKLVQERLRIENRIEALLFTHGIQSIAPPPNSISPAFKTRFRGAIRFSLMVTSIGQNF